MSDLGQLLKKARLDKSISLEQLEETTKIRKRYLEAIEEGDYSILPGNFYVRAFIKSYAETVGLDPSEVLAMYKNVIPAPSEEQVVEPIRRKRNDARRTEKWSKWASTILMLAFILLILGVLYYFIKDQAVGKQPESEAGSDTRIHDRLPKEPAISADPGTQQPSLPDTNKQQDPVPPAQDPVVTFAGTRNNIDYYTVEHADKLVVQLQVIGAQCWLHIDKVIPATEGKKEERQMIEEKLFTKDETREWTSEQSLYLRIGAAAASSVTLNGTPIEFEAKASVKSLQFDLKKAES